MEIISDLVMGISVAGLESSTAASAELVAGNVGGTFEAVVRERKSVSLGFQGLTFWGHRYNGDNWGMSR